MLTRRFRIQALWRSRYGAESNGDATQERSLTAVGMDALNERCSWVDVEGEDMTFKDRSRRIFRCG